jgi:beta-galactosidase
MLEPIDPGSRERWKRDLEQIRSLGFNTVRTWVEWTACEPTPERYDFANLKLLCELADEVGLKVVVQVYVDSAPDWVAERFPEARFVAQSGQPIPSQSAPGFCFDHSEVRAKILAFFRETAKVATSYPNFWGWDLWSEPHIINWAIIDFVPNASFCYCPGSRQRFRDWLTVKYGTLAKLNEAWYRRFTKWEQVDPPRFGTILSYTDFIDWRVYIQQKLAEDLRLRAQAVKEVDPRKVVTSHAAVPCLFTSPLWGVGAPDDWLMAESVDYFGTSIYPKHSFPKSHWDLQRLSVLMDFARSAGRLRRGFYVGELQAGMGIRGTVVGDPVTAQDHRLWAWGLVSRGARAVNVYAYYPMNSGYEAGGYGLIDLDGSLTERSREIGKIARTVGRHASFFARAVPPPAQVAIIYNPLAFMVGGEQHLSEAGAVRDSLIGTYRAFWRRNLASDFVHLRGVEAGGLQGYRAAFLPYPLMLTARAAGQLKRFVETGGTLVAEARCGWNDDRGYSQDVIPGFGLDQVLQVREGTLQMQDRVEMRVVAEAPWLEGVRSGDVLIGKGIREQLLPRPGAKVLASFSDGSAAITAADFGQGRAIAVGSFLGLANGQQPNQTAEAFFRAAAGAAGVRPSLDMKGVPDDCFVEIRRLETDNAAALFLFNHSTQEVAPELPLRTGLNLESGQTEELGRVVLKAGEIKVFLLKP